MSSDDAHVPPGEGPTDGPRGGAAGIVVTGVRRAFGDVVAVEARERREVADDVPVVADAEHGLGVPLAVEGERLVGAAVEMDRELGDAQPRPGAHEVLGAVMEGESAGEREFTVQPGVQEGPAVHFHPCLQPAVLPGGGPGLELERRGIRVRAEDVEPGGGAGRRGDGPCDQGAVADDEEAAGTSLPRVLLRELPESRG